jgi:hypothetical protein
MGMTWQACGHTLRFARPERMVWKRFIDLVTKRSSWLLLIAPEREPIVRAFLLQLRRDFQHGAVAWEDME